MRAEKSAITADPAEVEPDVARLEHQLSRRRGVLRLEIDLPRTLAPLAALDAQLLERPHSALVARAARLDALADPRLLLGELLVEQGGVLGLDVERRALLEHVVVVAARPALQPAAIELHDARRQAPHERAIVADEEQRAGEIRIIISSSQP